MNDSTGCNRRDFILRAGGAALALSALRATAQETPVAPLTPMRKVKLGIVGCGSRGAWMAGLFAAHGGFEIRAVADYFADVSVACGATLGVPKERCFSGLSGYKRVIESGIEAVVLETPPYFCPEQAAAAVAAGLHVFAAAPVAVDVPGALRMAELAKAATAKSLVAMVDYQIPTDPVNADIRQRIKDGGLGEMAYLNTFGLNHGYPDPVFGSTIENRLQSLSWVNTVALGGDYIGSWDIHALDAALWVLGRLPVAAAGHSRIARRDPHGDARDVVQVIYEYEGGLLHTHVGQALPNVIDDTLTAKFYGRDAYAEIVYWGKSILRGGDKSKAGKIESLYQNAPPRNIASFHDSIVRKRCENESMLRASDGCLLYILGREAAARGTRLTMAELIKENGKLEVDLKGLKD